jgi:hypothetical protein
LRDRGKIAKERQRGEKRERYRKRDGEKYTEGRNREKETWKRN